MGSKHPTFESHFFNQTQRHLRPFCCECRLVFNLEWFQCVSLSFLLIHLVITSPQTARAQLAFHGLSSWYWTQQQLENDALCVDFVPDCCDETAHPWRLWELPEIAEKLRLQGYIRLKDLNISAGALENLWREILLLPSASTDIPHWSSSAVIQGGNWQYRGWLNKNNHIFKLCFLMPCCFQRMDKKHGWILDEWIHSWNIDWNILTSS